VAQENQNKYDNQDEPDSSNAPVTVTVPIATEATAKPAKQKYNQNNQEDRSECHLVFSQLTGTDKHLTRTLDPATSFRFSRPVVSRAAKHVW
jgi:hypothetical protein